ncbi:MAG: hypothetical protein HYU51_15105 [Candidatus Rokubacteria bacterium]|nr:hypothetical protein [Candidatus Rokubacteria bacterium]
MKPIVIAVIVLMTAVTPAWAEHRTLGEADVAGAAERPTTERAMAGGPSSTDLELQLGLGLNGFRLGGRLLGPDGVAGAWLNGGMGPNGFALDGRVQRNDGRAWNFKLDAEMIDDAARLAWRWLRGRMLTFEDGGRI